MSTTSPLVSIVTVVYNGEKHLQQTINSVASQTYKKVEYIIIDGGSKDNTINIIKKNKDKITDWISEPDNGIYDAMNKGVNMTKGELIGIINSDDWYDINIVETVVNEYLKHPDKSIFHGDRYNILESGYKELIKFSKSNFRFKYFCMTYSHPSMFVSKEVYKSNNYNTNLKLYSDYQLVLTLFLKSSKQFHYINKALVYFRLGGESSNESFFNELKESFIARRKSKMNLFECVFAFILVLILRPIINLLKTLKTE